MIGSTGLELKARSIGFRVVKENAMHATAEFLLAVTKPIVLDFSASWCPTCPMLKPVIKKLAIDSRNAQNVRSAAWFGNSYAGRKSDA
jgi:thiol-disulfide isomerase/thioredoxin